MAKTIRTILLVVGVIQLFFAAAFFWQWSFAVNLWPFEGTTPLTFIFISSIFAAAGASTLWVVLSKNDGALAGIGLDYVFILVPVSLLSFQLGTNGGNAQMIGYGVACVLGAIFGLGLFLWSVRVPMDTTVPMPTLVRISFMIFILALLIVSIQLILKAPNIIPWKITPDLSVMIGWMFIGAAFYFAYGLLRPSWVNAAGQLWGFLAYDVVLIFPFLTRLPTITPEFRTGIIIYTIVVVYSGLLAIYYLFVARGTRIWGS